MTIDEAIRLLQETTELGCVREAARYGAAVDLGIEALKAVKGNVEGDIPRYIPLLPGETP